MEKQESTMSHVKHGFGELTSMMLVGLVIFIVLILLGPLMEMSHPITII